MHARTSSPFSAVLLEELFAFVAATAAARPQAVYARPGDVVWRLPMARLVELGEIQWLRLWFDADGVAGYAWFEPPTGVELDLRVDLGWHGDVGNALLDWSERMRARWQAAYPWLVDLENMAQWAAAVKQPAATRQDGYWLAIPANEDDHARVAALRRRGYAPTRHYAITYSRDLTAPLPPSQLPAPYRFRHATDALLDERVGVHRDAWVGSSWTLQAYKALRATRPYDESLDLVVEDTRHGRFLACCICWSDPVSRAGHFEPVGTRPAARGKGLTRELIREGFRRLAERGMATAHAETPGFNTPAQALYESSGFTPTGRRRTYIKRLDAPA